jgi:hypothetical protein
MKDKCKIIRVELKDIKDKYQVHGSQGLQWQNNKILFFKEKMMT